MFPTRRARRGVSPRSFSLSPRRSRARALASDYEGDYRLYSGYHSGCEEVSYGINRTASDLTGRDESFRNDSVFYARFHVLTPSAFNATDASGGSSRTHNLFAFGGSSNSGRVCNGYFGGVVEDRTYAHGTRGRLFFAHRGSCGSSPTMFLENGPGRRLSGEATKVEFFYLWPNATLRMYADGDLVYEAFNASLDKPVAGPLSVGLGGHLAPSAGAVSEDAWGGCFSPNYLERLSGPRERLFGRANDQKSSGEMRAIYGPKGRKYDPTGRNLTCETPNRWDELDGGDVMWCPADWRGDPPPRSLPPVAFSPRENRCDAKVRAPAAPMYSYSATEPWQRNALLSNEHQSDEVNLADLGSYDEFDERFAYVRLRFTTPEYFNRPRHSLSGSGDPIPREGRIRLFALDLTRYHSDDNPPNVKMQTCVSLFPVYAPDAEGDFSPIRQYNNKAKVVIHECAEDARLEELHPNVELNPETHALEPSTDYSLEIKFNFRKSERAVDIYLQGVHAQSSPYAYYPCVTVRNIDGDLTCMDPRDDWEDFMYFYNDRISARVAFGDNNAWRESYDIGTAGSAELPPGIRLSLGEASAPWTREYYTDWGGVFGQPYNASDLLCAREDQCLLLTGPDGTWGRWTSGELHFCEYPAEPNVPPAPPSPPAFDRAMYLSAYPLETFFPAPPALGAGALVGPFVGANESVSIEDPTLFRLVEARLSGRDAYSSGAGAANITRLADHQHPREAAYVVWTCDPSRSGDGELAMVSVRFVETDGIVLAVSDGAKRANLPNCAGAADETVTVEWGISSNARNVATGPDDAGLGVSEARVEAYLPVEMLTTAALWDETFSTVGNGTALSHQGRPVAAAMPAMAYLVGAGMRDAPGEGSIVHVVDEAEFSNLGACVHDTGGEDVTGGGNVTTNATAENCETVCEGHGYDESECLNITGCQWDATSGSAGECWSAVGSNPCDYQSGGRRLLAKDGTGGASRRRSLLRAPRRARALLNTYSFPTADEICDAWRDSKVCGGHAHTNDQTACESYPSAYGCTWGENPWDPDGGMRCLNAEGLPYGNSDIVNSVWSSYNDMTNCYQHHDLDSCNTDSDCFYTSNNFCSTKLHRKLQILEDASAPAHIMGLAVDKGLHDHCSQFSDEVSCGDEAPMCFWDSSASKCWSFHEYAMWNMSDACGEPYVSDDNIAIAYGYADMAALESAAISGAPGSMDSGSYGGPQPSQGDGQGPAECFENEGDTVAVSGCNCHSTCASCGYNSMPTEDADCITCQPGHVLQQFYPDGTGFCYPIPPGDGQGPEACYANPDDLNSGTVISGCRCHSECAKCGFGESPWPDTQVSCITCAEGLDFHVVDDNTGTGVCFNDNGPSPDSGSNTPTSGSSPDSGSYSSCLSVVPPQNGQLGACSGGIDHGAQCSPTCDDGYLLASNSTCDDGTYTSGQCVAYSSCLSVVPPQNGQLGACEGGIDHGAQCSPTCDDGYLLASNSTCDDGSFQPGRCVYAGPYPDAASLCPAWRDQVYCNVINETCSSDTHGLCEVDANGNCVAKDAAGVSAFAKLQDKLGMANKDASDACAVHADDSLTVCADAGCYWDAFPDEDEDGDRCVPTIASERARLEADGANDVALAYHDLEGLSQTCEPLGLDADACAAAADARCQMSQWNDDGIDRCGFSEPYYLVSAALACPGTDFDPIAEQFDTTIFDLTAPGCPAVAAPQNGQLGACSGGLDHGASCLPTCEEGFKAYGIFSCFNGTITSEATCEYDGDSPFLLPAVAGMVAACDYPAKANLSGAGTMRFVRLAFSHDEDNSYVRQVEAGATADVVGCHYKVHNKTEMMSHWNARARVCVNATAVSNGTVVSDATLATRVDAPEPNAVGVKMMSFHKTTALAPPTPIRPPPPPGTVSDIERKGECECPATYELHGFADMRPSLSAQNS